MSTSTDVPEAGGWTKVRWVLRNMRPLIARRLSTSSTRLCGRDLTLVPLEEAAAAHGWPRIDLPARPAAEFWPELRSAAGGPPTYPPRPCIVAMRNVMVVSYSRFVVPDQRSLVADELWHFRDDPDAGLKIFTLDRSGAPSRARLLHLRQAREALPPSLHAMHEHGSNYFHAVVEVAPRIHLARQDPRFADLPILVNEKLPASIERMLRIVGGSSPLVKLKPGLIYPAAELAFPSDFSFIQDVYNRPRRPDETIIHVEAVRAVADHIVAALGLSSLAGGRRLYLRRGGLMRRLTNESEIEARLTQLGFEVIQPGALSFEDQVRQFREAACIVSPTGAALTNMVWCRPGTRVVVLAADHPAMPNEIWAQLGAAPRAEVSVVSGPSADEAGLHGDFSVDVDEVERAL